jgi:hypothetical protein
MLRLCSESSRSYSGRPVRHAANTAALSAVTQAVIGQESAAAIVSEDIVILGGMMIGNELRPVYTVPIAEVSPH